MNRDPVNGVEDLLIVSLPKGARGLFSALGELRGESFQAYAELLARICQYCLAERGPGGPAPETRRSEAFDDAEAFIMLGRDEERE